MSLVQSIVPFLARRPASNAELGATIKPQHSFYEAPDAWTLTVYLPGVTRENLEVTTEAGALSIVGRRVWQQPKDWTALYRETSSANFAATFEYDLSVDEEKIRAELKDGVLQVTLPKAAALQPRRIAVQ